MLREHGAGVRWELDVGDTFWLATLYYLGEWREMARLTQLLLRDAIERGDAVAQQGLRTGRCNLAWLLLDRPDEAREQLAIAERRRGPGFLWQHAQAVIAAVNIELYTGDAAAAGQRLADAERPRAAGLPADAAGAHRAGEAARAGGAAARGAEGLDPRPRRSGCARSAPSPTGLTQGGRGLGDRAWATSYAPRRIACAARRCRPRGASCSRRKSILVGNGMMGFLLIARMRRGCPRGRRRRAPRARRPRETC